MSVSKALIWVGTSLLMLMYKLHWRHSQKNPKDLIWTIWTWETTVSSPRWVGLYWSRSYHWSATDIFSNVGVVHISHFMTLKHHCPLSSIDLSGARQSQSRRLQCCLAVSPLEQLQEALRLNLTFTNILFPDCRSGDYSFIEFYMRRNRAFVASNSIHGLLYDILMQTSITSRRVPRLPPQSCEEVCRRIESFLGILNHQIARCYHLPYLGKETDSTHKYSPTFCI